MSTKGPDSVSDSEFPHSQGGQNSEENSGQNSEQNTEEERRPRSQSLLTPNDPRIKKMALSILPPRPTSPIDVPQATVMVPWYEETRSRQRKSETHYSQKELKILAEEKLKERIQNHLDRNKKLQTKCLHLSL